MFPLSAHSDTRFRSCHGTWPRLHYYRQVRRMAVTLQRPDTKSSTISRTKSSDHLRLAMSPPILYLVTTKSSAMVCSCCSSSDILPSSSVTTFRRCVSSEVRHTNRLDSAAPARPPPAQKLLPSRTYARSYAQPQITAKTSQGILLPDH